MIQFLADGIDQLDLALDQLAVRERNFDRFAFMLIDNVVELTLHRFAQDRAAENDLWRALKKPKNDPKTVQQALGQRFDAKVRLASDLGLVKASTAASILTLHGFRNTAYHQGLRHEHILHSLALFYFRTACAMLEAYKPRSWSWSSNDTLSHRARKYLGDAYRGDHAKIFPAAYRRLADVAGSMPGSLVDDLTADMSTTVDELDNVIHFLATDSPQPMTRAEAVVHAQAWKVAFTEEGLKWAHDNGWKDGPIFAYVEWLIKHYPWPTPKDPIPSWRSRVQSLRSERNEDLALKKYHDFMRQTESVRSMIMEFASQLDDFIQSEIDRARGK